MRIPAIVLSSAAMVLTAAPVFAQSLTAPTGTLRGASSNDEEMVHSPITTPPPSWSQRSFATAVPTGGDAQLATLIESRAASIPGVDLSAVQIHALHGAITFSGTVPDDATREHILVAANQVDGVVVVRDEMTLPGNGEPARGGGPIDDTQIAQSTREALAHDPWTNGRRIDVRSMHGLVTLNGRVGTWHDAERLVQDARGVAGVRGVRSDLVVGQGRVVDASGHPVFGTPPVR